MKLQATVQDTGWGIASRYQEVKTQALACMEKTKQSIGFHDSICNTKIQPTKVLSNLKDRFFPQSPLAERLRENLKSEELTSQFSTKYRIKNDVLNNLIEGIRSSEFKALRGDISKVLSRLNTQSLNIVFEKLFLACADENPLLVVNKLKSLLSLQKIEYVVDTKCHLKEGTFSAIKEATKLKGIVAKKYQSIIDEKKQSFIAMVKVYVVNILEWLKNNFKMAFALNDLGGEVEDTSSATMRIMMLSSLWGSINVWLTSLNTLVGSAAITATTVSSGLFVCTAALYVYFKYLEPAPEFCSPFVNYTSEAKKGNKNIVPVTGRDKEVKELEEALCANSGGIRAHPLILGPSGSGKTEIVKELARRIAKGEVNEKLKNKKLFYINTADLISENTSKMGKSRLDSLSKFQKVMQGNEHNVIVFLDEIHLIGSKNAVLAEKLKSFFDPGPGGFPFCITATTPTEYDQYIAGNWAFERRLSVIPIDQTDGDATRLILKNMAIREAPDIEIEDSAIEFAYLLTKKHFPQNAQPAIAKTILAKAISKVRSRQQPDDRVLKELKDKQSRLINSFLHSGKETQMFTPEGKQLSSKLEELDTQINAEQIVIQEEVDKYASFAKLKESRNELNYDTHMMALKIAQGNTSEDFKKEFTFKQYYVKPALDAEIERKKAEFSEATIKVDQNLIIDVVYDELLKNEQSEKSRVNPEISQALSEVKKYLAEMAVKINKGNATQEEIENYKLKRKHILPELEKAMSNK